MSSSLTSPTMSGCSLVKLRHSLWEREDGSSNLSIRTSSLWYIAAMRFLIAYDAWFAGRVETLLVWLEEWLSISQKVAERGMIALYLVLIQVPPVRASWFLGFRIAFGMWVAFVMGWQHRRPAAMRGSAKHYPSMGASRAVMQIVLLWLAGVLFLAPPHRVYDIAVGAAQIVYLVFFYMTDIASNGERGRRRKLALAELKKLFGTEWLPKPLPVPQ